MNKWIIKYCILRLQINTNNTKDENYDNETIVLKDDYFIYETSKITTNTLALINHTINHKLNNILIFECFNNSDIYSDFKYCNDDISNNLIIKINDNNFNYIYKYTYEIIKV